MRRCGDAAMRRCGDANKCRSKKGNWVVWLGPGLNRAHAGLTVDKMIVGWHLGCDHPYKGVAMRVC